MTAPAEGVAGGALRLRLAFGLAVIAALPAALTGWITSTALERAETRRAAALLDGLDDRADRWLESERRQVETALAAMEQELRRSRTTALQQWLLGRPDHAAAQALAGAHGLDLLEVFDGEGQVVGGSASRVGLRDPAAAVEGGERAALRPARAPGGAPVMLARREVGVGERAVTLVGARALDEAKLHRLAGIDAALLVVEGAAPVGRGGRAAELDARELATASRTRKQIVGSDGGRWVASIRPLSTPDGAQLGRLVLAAERPVAGVAAAWRAALWAGLAAALLAAVFGFWLGGRLSRPVDELVRAVDAVSAGEADYTFSGAGRGEIDRVAAAFSRLKRSHETQRRRSAAAERVAAWREVARRVAHEVKNPLAPIRLTAQNLVRARRSGHARFDTMFEDGMHTIQEEVEQLTRLVDAFSEFARLPAPRPQPLDVVEQVEHTLELYATDPRWSVQRDYAAGLPRVAADPDQLSRALKNVVLNAVEAMGDHGTLEVRVAPDGDRVVIEVADDGPGFAEGSVSRLFEPYFTTKASGTGLGLAIAYRILVEHGGEIHAENRPERGARVVLRLPATSAEGRSTTGAQGS